MTDEEFYTDEPCNCCECCGEPTPLKDVYIITDASWLTKFKKDEEVVVVSEPNENWEVQVYKTENNWRNENGNKVKYTIRFSRLRPLFYKEQIHQTTFDEIRNKKTFTDATVEKAEEMYDTVLEFVWDIMNFKTTLENTASNLRALALGLLSAVETKDSKKLFRLMNNCKDTIKFIKDDPMMKDLRWTMKQFDTRDIDVEEFNPIDLIG